MRGSDSRAPWLYRFVSDRTAQSEPLAVVLLIGITMVGSGVVVLYGANAIETTKETTDLGQAEHAMTQLDSKASLVAHGSTDVQRVSLFRNNRGDVRIEEDGKIATGQSADTDTVVASVKAYVNALNRLIVRREKLGSDVKEVSYKDVG